MGMTAVDWGYMLPGRPEKLDGGQVCRIGFVVRIYHQGRYAGAKFLGLIRR
jgi:hypothetical protein